MVTKQIQLMEHPQYSTDLALATSFSSPGSRGSWLATRWSGEEAVVTLIAVDFAVAFQG
jgi:hypothetical protein